MKLSQSQQKEADDRDEIVLKKDVLQMIATGNFINDVPSWKGLAQSDPAARSIIEKAPKDKPYPAAAFIQDYLALKDDKTLSQKVAALRSIVGSASDAEQRTAILPTPSASSVSLLIDKLAVEQLMGLSGIAGFSPALFPSMLIGGAADAITRIAR